MNSFIMRLGVVLITVYFIGLGILQVTYEGSISLRAYLITWFIAVMSYMIISFVIAKYNNIGKY